MQVLAGDDEVYYCCEKCKAKTAATVYMRIHRFPRILQLHIKRFKYAGAPCLQMPLVMSIPHVRINSRAARRSSDRHGRTCFQSLHVLYTAATCHLAVYPVLHAVRIDGACMCAGLTREKLTANVSFPLKGLKLSEYGSKEAVLDEDGVECVHTRTAPLHWLLTPKTMFARHMQLPKAPDTVPMRAVVAALSRHGVLLGWLSSNIAHENLSSLAASAEVSRDFCHSSADGASAAAVSMMMSLADDSKILPAQI